MFRNLGHEGNTLKGKGGLMAGVGCTQETLHFPCDGLQYCLKGNSICNINLCVQVGSLLVMEKSARVAMTDGQRP